MSEQEFRLAILKLALCFCFGDDEESLSVDQIVERGLTPIEAYTRYCVTELICHGAVETMHHSPQLNDDVPTAVVIKRSVQCGLATEEFVYSISRALIDLIFNSPEYDNFLRLFLEDVKACECIEYSLYYGEKSEINIVNPSVFDTKLRLLILGCHQEKIHMLLWRAIKKYSISRRAQNIPFSDITNAAFNYYLQYSRGDVEIERYQRPKVLRSSKLSGMLEIFCSSRKQF